MKASAVVGLLAFGLVVGAVLGWVLSKYWWDFPPEDVENYGWLIGPFYGTLGAIIGLIVAALLIPVISAFLRLRRANEA